MDAINKATGIPKENTLINTSQTHNGCWPDPHFHEPGDAWENRIDVSGILVALGGLSIGIGFGLQNIASNLASGVILIFERPIKIGDRVSVGDTFGTVTAINLRTTVVTTPEDIDIIEPNSKFISEAVTNMTQSNKRTRKKVPVGASYQSGEDLVKQILLEVVHSHPEILKKLNNKC